jgi:NADPH:quinone reductase-like Zn-dependent oxidoreductase
MWKRGSLHGIRVGDIDSFQQMNRAIELNQIRPIIDRSFPFDEAMAAYRHQASGNFIGKVVITV